MSIYKYWGKAESKGGYHLLPYHSLDVAAVGDVMMEMNPMTLEKFSELSTVEKDDLKKLLLFFLAIHDLGKYSDSFQHQIPDIYSKLNPDSKFKTYNIRHDSLGYMLWLEKFLSRKSRTLNGKLLDDNFFQLQSESGKEIKSILEIFLAGLP